MPAMPTMPPAPSGIPLAFDDAVKTAFDFYKAHRDDTLIVVVGDHETGGMGLGMDSMGYKLDMASLMNVHLSVEDSLGYGAQQYKGNRAAYTAMLAKDFGLANLTDTETAKLTTAFDAADAGKKVGYYKINPAAPGRRPYALGTGQYQLDHHHPYRHHDSHVRHRAGVRKIRRL